MLSYTTLASSASHAAGPWLHPRPAGSAVPRRRTVGCRAGSAPRGLRPRRLSLPTGLDSRVHLFNRRTTRLSPRRPQSVSSTKRHPGQPLRASPTGNTSSPQEINEVLGSEREECRRGYYHVAVQGQCGGEVPVKKSCQRTGTATGVTGGDTKKMPPQAEVRPLSEPLRWYEQERPQRHHQNWPPRYPFGENGHNLSRSTAFLPLGF